MCQIIYGHMTPDGVESNPLLRRSRAASTPSLWTFNTARSDESRRVDLLVYKCVNPMGVATCGEYAQNTIGSVLPYFEIRCLSPNLTAT